VRPLEAGDLELVLRRLARPSISEDDRAKIGRGNVIKLFKLPV
jgi:hypothetical protein